MQIFHSSIIFWAAWVIIPIVMEIIPTIGNFVKKKKSKKKIIIGAAAVLVVAGGVGK